MNSDDIKIIATCIAKAMRSHDSDSNDDSDLFVQKVMHVYADFLNSKLKEFDSEHLNLQENKYQDAKASQEAVPEKNINFVN